MVVSSYLLIGSLKQQPRIKGTGPFYLWRSHPSFAKEGYLRTQPSFHNSDICTMRVLIVDDSPVSRELVRDILEPNGYEVFRSR